MQDKQAEGKQLPAEAGLTGATGAAGATGATGVSGATGTGQSQVPDYARIYAFPHQELLFRLLKAVLIPCEIRPIGSLPVPSHER